MKRTLIFTLTALLLVVLGTILYLNFESNEANNSTELISQNVSSSSRIQRLMMAKSITRKHLSMCLIRM